jgi:hypothetical protein
MVSSVVPAPTKGKKPRGFWNKKRVWTAKGLVGLAFVSAVAGGVAEKGSMDQQVKDLQAQVTDLQNQGPTGSSGTSGTDQGAVVLGTDASTGASLVSKKKAPVTHPQALSPSQHKYKCTRVG